MKMFWIPIDRSIDVPLIRQVYQHIRERILDGELRAGDKLPSTRELASDLDVSRNVILEAYDQLLAEGFIETRKGSGTFIASGTYLAGHKKVHVPLFVYRCQDGNKHNDVINFRSGIPELDLFPRRTWTKLSHSIWTETSSSAFGYDLPEGRQELRNVLSRYLLKTRGVYCHPEQLVITSGATQALTLVARLLLSTGDEVIMEDPITNDIQTIFASQGASLYPIPVDGDGMKTSLLPENKKPKFVFATPSHQFPLGGTLPIQRRIELINYARETGGYIIEDDYDSEFRYEGPPVSSLQGLESEHVIYIGSFSKILSPALRMGYVILPPQLIESCRRLKWFTDLHTPSPNQLILARFIGEGYLERHTSRMKKLYRNRRDVLIRCLKAVFPEQVKILGESTGLHLVVEFHERSFSKEELERMLHFGVRVYPVEDHAIEKGKHRNRLILGYGHLKPEEIEEGIARLHRAVAGRL
ncbi:transcriptional regulator, GntR family [Aneurinibacillus aneurinilyticus ATCC 12856]|uniref:Transcriptional regulator, GntR family n=2 Tax=Aneurinibacillus aneurinilyticus TaxID=1391 RepID=U1WTQ1_ANEAE|nr:transcriptional regulator, GntR family [Aneurinibacillus aneurinilyticus ATCC 12856]